MIEFNSSFKFRQKFVRATASDAITEEMGRRMEASLPESGRIWGKSTARVWRTRLQRPIGTSYLIVKVGRATCDQLAEWSDRCYDSTAIVCRAGSQKPLRVSRRRRASSGSLVQGYSPGCCRFRSQ